MNIFEIARGTECEPKQSERERWAKGSYIPDVFLEYKGVRFGIGMDEKLYIHEDGVWRKA